MKPVGEQQQEARRRVVVVDPSEDARTVLALLFIASDCDVRQMQGEEGVVELVQMFRPHAVFLDAHLGNGSTGLSLARKLCEQERASRPLIVIMSAWAMEKDRVAPPSACADLFYAKPADPDELIAVALSGNRRATPDLGPDNSACGNKDGDSD